jgi:hypothetical protein
MQNKILTASAQAKILKTQRRVLEALTSLTSEDTPKKLTISEVCRTAGISPDALALPHHEELKRRVETGIAEHNRANFGKTRRKRNPATDVAVARIERLEEDLDTLRQRYDSAVLSVRALALSLQEALVTIDDMRRQNEELTRDMPSITPRKSAFHPKK